MTYDPHFKSPSITVERWALFLIVSWASRRSVAASPGLAYIPTTSMALVSDTHAYWHRPLHAVLFVYRTIPWVSGWSTTVMPPAHVLLVAVRSPGTLEITVPGIFGSVPRGKWVSVITIASGCNCERSLATSARRWSSPPTFHVVRRMAVLFGCADRCRRWLVLSSVWLVCL